MSKEGSRILKIGDVSGIATSIATMYTDWNHSRSRALEMAREVREYMFATDIDTTSASNLDHKNRTHIPKVTQISDTLQSLYHEAAFGEKKFFEFTGNRPSDKQNADNIEKWLGTKLEQKKFRSTVGRQLVEDYVEYGNIFLSVDYVHEKDDAGLTTFKGSVISRVSPLDIVFDPTSDSFSNTSKIVKKRIHIAKLAELPDKFPNAGFDEALIAKIVKSRQSKYVEDWVDTIKDNELRVDGYGSMEEYLKSGFVEILIYRGDIFDDKTGKIGNNRIIYVVDRMHVIRNEPNSAPTGFDGLHHAGYRVRSNNLWRQGPLDNLIGMQYKIDHLENLKADIFDIIANPVLKIRGTQVIEPENGFAPDAVYQLGADGDVNFLVPDVTALQADTQIAQYFKMMEDFAGVPPEARGIRSPGEKTAFEVSTLDNNASKRFKDGTRLFELAIESALQEAYLLMLQNFDGDDYILAFEDITGEEELKQLAEEDIRSQGSFIAVGSRHFDRKNRMTQEMQQFQLGPAQDPKVRAHLSGFALAKFYEEKLGIADAEIIEQYAGVKEDVTNQAVAQSEAQRLQSISGEAQPQVGSAGVQDVSAGQGQAQ